MSKTIVAILVGVMLSFAGAASAADAKIAIANPARVFAEMQELKELRAKMDSERKLLEGVDQERVQKIKALQAARDALKVDSPQYQEKNSEYLKAAIEYETWGKINQANFQREQKIQMKLLYQKIENAIEEVAKQKGFDLVLTEQRPDLPEDIDRLNLDQLRQLINQRTVLYSTKSVDISDDVLMLLDSRYRSAGKSEK